MSGFQTFLAVCGGGFALGLVILVVFGHMAERLGEVILGAFLMQWSAIVAAVGSVAYAVIVGFSGGGEAADPDAPVCVSKARHGDRWTCTEWDLPRSQP